MRAAFRTLGCKVNQVETELQADCLAGAWAKDAEARKLLEVGDIDEALNARGFIVPGLGDVGDRLYGTE